jgi:hypothetical protein
MNSRDIITALILVGLGVAIGYALAQKAALAQQDEVPLAQTPGQKFINRLFV